MKNIAEKKLEGAVKMHVVYFLNRLINDFISYDQSQEKEICKDCKDRVGLPCLFVFNCDKLKEAEQALKGGAE